MQPYGNQSGTSGVTAYEIGPDFIQVQFDSGAPYTYTHESVGRSNVEQMKTLAVAGQGLSTFISQHPLVRDGFVR